jgi:hypothetical protein
MSLRVLNEDKNSSNFKATCIIKLSIYIFFVCNNKLNSAFLQQIIIIICIIHSHLQKSVLGGFTWFSKFTPWFSRITRVGRFTLNWNRKIVKYQTVAWISPRFLPAGQRQIMCTNTCFICHCPNQSEHHATLPNIILIYPLVFKRGVLRQEFLRQMPFLMQPSPFPGLGLSPPMAPITVEAGNL